MPTGPACPLSEGSDEAQLWPQGGPLWSLRGAGPLAVYLRRPTAATNLHHRHIFHGVLEAFSHLVKRGLDLFDATEASIDTTGDGQAASPAPASLHTVHTPSTPPCTRV